MAVDPSLVHLSVESAISKAEKLFYKVPASRASHSARAHLAVSICRQILVHRPWRMELGCATMTTGMNTQIDANEGLFLLLLGRI